jgi:hypothetical protein
MFSYRLTKKELKIRQDYEKKTLDIIDMVLKRRRRKKERMK